MKWHRDRNGLYTAGPYAVLNVSSNPSIWTASGPDLTGVFPTKRQAQIACGNAASERAANPAAVPVVGDAVIVSGTRRGQITAIMRGDHEPLYCIVFARGRKLCLFRREIEVIVP